jgi:pimeloyl-ACP methyl ester carboxylesterase
MSSIKPFKISVPDSAISILNSKLEATKFPDELSDAGWTMGSPLADIKRLTAVWKDTFSWRKAEAHLNNTLPQFTTSISVPNFPPLEVHFVHALSPRPNAIPLLFVHGWPGSFYEVIKLLPLLTNPSSPDAPAFHVIAPSLPNFGFSEGPARKGFGLAQYAQTLHTLMQTLNYTQYVTQGGDWGAFITRIMANLYPESVKTAHSNLPVSGFPKPWKNPIVFLQALWGIAFSPSQRAGLAHSQQYLKSGNGYLTMQDTKPQTLAYALADSPTALLAWIYEKLHDWTDAYPWTDDEILTWVSIYYFSRAGPAASVRIYYESTHPVGPGSISRDDAIMGYVAKVPFALAYFPAELVRMPFSWAATGGVIVRQTAFEAGGHFAAFEVPELLAGDLRALFGKRGVCAGVVDGKDGF